MKPGGLSRGRGIQLFKNLENIMEFFKNKDAPWIVMKYIENPLIIHKRKFDIRQWVLVTSYDPLIIWFYEESYIRFAAENY
jgi:tubulin monoglycylase TTLL3/8